MGLQTGAQLPQHPVLLALEDLPLLSLDELGDDELGDRRNVTLERTLTREKYGYGRNSL
jgi:hypothetical protein